MLTADKGVALVVLSRQNYINKAIDLLADRDTFRPLTLDPRNQHKNKLINTLRNITVGGGLGVTTYKRLYPIGTGLQNSVGYPKYTKGHPLRSIVSSRGATT